MINIIKKSIWIVFASIILISCSEKSNPVDNTAALDSNKTESRLAFEYLNSVRANPSAYNTEMGINLDTIKARPKLIWNNTLEKVAIEKATDMATRNYFAHVTPEGYGINYLINKAGYTLPAQWLSDPKANNFESIAAAYKGNSFISGQDFIQQLIIDAGVPDLGHRFHLLGVGPWYSSLVDIGIGISRTPNSTYRNYICVIIAKRS